MMPTFINLNALTVLSGIIVVLGIYVAWLEYYVRRDILAFDLVRATTIMATGWLTTGVATLIDPSLMGSSISPNTVMATSTLLCFLSVAVGHACFLAFRVQTRTRRHPWWNTIPVGERV